MDLEVVTIAVIFRSPENVEVFPVRINEDNYILARGKMEFERDKIIDYLKSLREKGLIKSVYRPKNKKLQKQLNHLVKAKRSLAESINKIKLVYRNI